MKKLLFILLLGLCAEVSHAEPILTNEALFIRCYGQLTQLRVAPTNPLYLEVKSGSKDPISACMEVFDRALFTSSNKQIANSNDVVAKAVLRTMHKLHASWFEDKDYPEVSSTRQFLGNRDIHDTETPAFYFTRAMFRPGTDFSTALTLNSHLRAIRTTQDPTTGAYSQFTKDKTVFGFQVPFAPVGEILGISDEGAMSTPYTYVFNAVPTTGTVNIGAHYGGGVLGSVPYLLMTVSENALFKANGGVSMPRRWARAVYSDLLCRNFPVVRYEDVSAFVKATSSIPFRKQQACVQCHASMDRVASGIRGYQLKNIGPLDESFAFTGVSSVDFAVPNSTAGTDWPSEPDSTYHQKQPDGVLFYRNTSGALVNNTFRGIAALGQLLSTQPDFYYCAAKRYYSYFMGVDAVIDDSSATGSLPSGDALHRANILALGDALKSNQRVRSLIESLLRLDQYKMVNFGAQ